MVCRENKPLGSGYGVMKGNWIRAGLAMALCLCVLRAWPQQPNTAEAAFQFQGDPAAHQLYENVGVVSCHLDTRSFEAAAFP